MGPPDPTHHRTRPRAPRAPLTTGQGHGPPGPHSPQDETTGPPDPAHLGTRPRAPRALLTTGRGHGPPGPCSPREEAMGPPDPAHLGTRPLPPGPCSPRDKATGPPDPAHHGTRPRVPRTLLTSGRGQRTGAFRRPGFLRPLGRWAVAPKSLALGGERTGGGTGNQVLSGPEGTSPRRPASPPELAPEDSAQPSATPGSQPWRESPPLH